MPSPDGDHSAYASRSKNGCSDGTQSFGRPSSSATPSRSTTPYSPRAQSSLSAALTYPMPASGTCCAFSTTSSNDNHVSGSDHEQPYDALGESSGARGVSFEAFQKSH